MQGCLLPCTSPHTDLTENTVVLNALLYHVESSEEDTRVVGNEDIVSEDVQLDYK